MLGTSANSLHRGPHVLIGPHQVPARRKKLRAFNASAFIDLFGRAGETIRYRLAPGNIAVAFDYGMRLSALERFLRKECSVDAAIHHPCAPFPGYATHLVATQSIASVNADAHNVSRLNAFR